MRDQRTRDTVIKRGEHTIVVLDCREHHRMLDQFSDDLWKEWIERNKKPKDDNRDNKPS